MSHQRCLTCRTLDGEINPPGGFVYDDGLWVVFLAARPIHVPGQGFIALKRHCEAIGELTDAEAQALGRVIHVTARAYEHAMQPVRVHFGLYAESVKHLHLHITPRMAHMPAGNIPLTMIGRWYVLLARLGLRKPFPVEQVACVAKRLRAAFAER